MKAYTDLNQSKKLAEILPVESADMHIISYQDDKGGYFDTALCYSKWDAIHTEGYYPCWSLAALLDAIPYNISFNRAVYRFKLVKFSKHWECYHENFGMASTEIFKADNPVDVCYKMILKLHELKML